MKKLISLITSAALSVSVIVSSGSQAMASYLYSESIDNEQYRCIVRLTEDPISKNETAKEMGVSEFILTDEGKEEYASIMEEHEFVQEQLSSFLGKAITPEYEYTAALNGFSFNISYSDFKKVKNSKETLGISDICLTAPIQDNEYTSETEAENTSESNTYSYESITDKVMEAVGVNDTGYSGDGMVIAIIDDSFDLRHEFLTMPEGVSGKISREDVKAISPYTSASSVGGKGFYYSEKIPFAFNYYSKVNDTLKDYAFHGTHVAGIAAGNPDAVTNTSYNPRGIAPNAQLALMSVYDLEDSKLLAAYDDCLYIGADVINASYGQGGVTLYNDTTIFEKEAINNITDTGTVFCAAAGNDGKSEFNSMDYSSGGCPDNITSTLSVGSAENFFTLSNFITVNENSYEILPGTINISEEFNGKTMEYVAVPGLGEESDYENIDVEGKIALVARGKITFDEKAMNAFIAGAEGIIFYNTAESSELTISCESLPSGLISYDNGMKMIDENKKVVSFSNKNQISLKYSKEVMSSFSSWDYTETLILKPDITGFGGNILSSYPNDKNTSSNSVHNKYKTLSGTSMSAPQLTGINALLKQYLKENMERYGITSEADYTELMAKLLMSTATPIYTSDGLELASPRVQGNGLANIADAINTPCYISSESETDNYRPKISLGEDKSGNYTLQFNIHNVSDTAQTYHLNEAVFCDSTTDGTLNWNTQRLIKDEDYNIKFMDPNYGAEIQDITVEPGSTAALTAQIIITGKYDKIFEEFKNGTFIDGYITLTGESVPDLTLSFMTFCGDWSENNKASLFEPFIYKNPDNEYGSYLSDLTNMAGMNILSYIDAFMNGEESDVNQFVSHPYFSPLTESDSDMDDVAFNILALNMYVKRRCYDITVEIYNTDEQGIDDKLVYKEVLGSGNTWKDSNGYLAENNYEIEWDFRDVDGEIHNNETYNIWIKAKTPLSDSYSLSPITQSFTIDIEKPVIESCGIINIGEEKYLMINASDNGELQGAISFSDDEELYDLTGAKNEKASESLLVGIPEDNSNGYIEVYDMAGNYETIYFSDISANEITLNAKSDLYFTSDEKTFKDKFYFTDESGQTVKVNFDFSSDPQTVYDEELGYTTLLINGDDTADIPVEVGLRGDANLSGKVDVRDASYIAAMMANKKSSNYTEFMESLAGYCGDYNKDGVTNVRDAAAIAAYLASRYQH
ncbi:S8 family serine peptidase [Porcipelethomonas sp.]|uniref:S8 family serine peptidase n=1 Tax=Porcipelethomonas sp. TaxID=2981675 RepID=UPI003EFA0715